MSWKGLNVRKLKKKGQPSLQLIWRELHLPEVTGDLRDPLQGQLVKSVCDSAVERTFSANYEMQAHPNSWFFILRKIWSSLLCTLRSWIFSVNKTGATTYWRRIISPLITFVSKLVVSFNVMCPGELIILKETKAILFPVSQDANLFWLVILLWGLLLLHWALRPTLTLPPLAQALVSVHVRVRLQAYWFLKKHSNVVLVVWLWMKTHMIWQSFRPLSDPLKYLEMPDSHWAED